MTRILVVMPMPPHIRADLSERLQTSFPDVALHVVESPAAAGPYIADADVLIAYHLPDAVIAAGRKVKWIQSIGTGVDGFVTRPSLRPDVLLTRMHGIQAEPGAEAALGSMFALARQLPAMLHNQQRHFWDRDTRASARLLGGRTVTIVGIGAIGEALARKCASLDMTVEGVSDGRQAVAGFRRIYPRAALVEAARQADFLVLLAPLTAATRHLINGTVFRAMKPGSYFINIARGGIVDENALVAALSDGQIAGAALDVFVEEPLPPDHPLWSFPNVIITPHAAGMHVDYVADLMPTLEHNIRCFLAGTSERMRHIVRRGGALEPL
jgi:D-2-hydroxyacid dehydrogenase (NADP+)